MQVEIKIDSTCKEPKIIIYTDKVTDEINNLVSKMTERSPKVLSGFRGDTLEILEQSIFSVSTQRPEKFTQPQTTGNIPCVCGCMNWKND